MKKGNLKDSFRHAIDGIVATTKKERNMRIHWIILLVVLLAGIILKISKSEWIDVYKRQSLSCTLKGCPSKG